MRKVLYSGVLGHDEMKCGMARGASEGVSYEDVNLWGDSKCST